MVSMRREQVNLIKIWVGTRDFRLVTCAYETLVFRPMFRFRSATTFNRAHRKRPVDTYSPTNRQRLHPVHQIATKQS